MELAGEVGPRLEYGNAFKRAGEPILKPPYGLSTRGIWSIFWRIIGSPTYSLLALSKEALATDRLKQENPNESYCGGHVEDIDHIFFECSNAKTFWINMVKANTNGQNFPQIAFTIWKIENTNVFEKRKNHISTQQAIAMAVEYCHVVARQNSLHVTITQYLKWHLLEVGTLKLNIDGAACASTGQGGIGGVFRNNRGDCVMSYMKYLTNTSAITAELQTLWEGLRIAIDHMLSPIVIDTDSTEVNDRAAGNSAIGHSYREHNQVADLIAKEGARKETLKILSFRQFLTRQCGQTS
ncbi:uncharacterized protein [Nicotiana tomentosiformis]|uniref:uncharacterized protein n=1 Tax=Nicotiana tomentosiformis TaxID=4098 RepID=UPI00388C73ED